MAESESKTVWARSVNIDRKDKTLLAMQVRPEFANVQKELAKRVKVGTLAVAKCGSGVCRVGEYGVCYEVYELNQRPGYSFIFERGGYDGFSPDDVRLFLEPTDLVASSVVDYKFQHVGRLKRDYQSGRFAEALSIRSRHETTS